jgi:hypothetical protein
MVQTGAAELQSRWQMLDAEGHVRGLDGNAEFAKQSREVWVGDFVKDHETGVNRHGTIIFSDGNCVRVAARVVVFLVKRQVEASLQQVGAAQTGDTGSDDGDAFHARRERGAGRFAAEKMRWLFS